MVQSIWQHVVLFIFAVSSTGLHFGFTLLEQNMGMAVYTFTTGCIAFSVVGLLLHINILNIIVKKLKLYATLAIAVCLQELGMILCYFASVTGLSYVSAILLATGTSICYSSLFFMFCEYKHFSVILGVGFAFSTMLFYITQLNKYCLAIIEGAQLLSFLLVRVPKDMEYYFQDFEKTRLSMRQLVSVSVFAGCFSKNILTNLYFEYSNNELVFSIGLLVSVFSGLLLFHLKSGIVISSILCSITCILFYFNDLYTFCVAFYIANLACSAMISAAFSINAQDGQKSNNTLVYLAMILGNCSGFFKDSSHLTKEWIFGICAVLCLMGILTLVELRPKSPESLRDTIKEEQEYENSSPLKEDELVE